MSHNVSPVEAAEQPMLRIPKSAHPTPTPARHTSRRVHTLVYVGGILAVVAGMVLGAQTLGWFQTSGQLTASTGERVVPAAGAATSEIKGWMTLQQVTESYPVTQAALYAHFAVPAGTPAETTLSELKESGTSSLDVIALRAWIDAGAPSTP